MPSKSNKETIAPTYVINHSASNNQYTVWHFDPSHPDLLTQITTNSGATLPKGQHLCAIGGYLLSYSPPIKGAHGNNIRYRLFNFDPKSPDPLNDHAIQQGLWEQDKFSGYYDHYTWDKEMPDILQLIPMTGYVLAFIPSSARGSYRLWNFDPAPTTPGTKDPLCNPITPQDAFSLIGEGSQLLPIGNYVLEWIAAQSKYRLWSFDPQEMTPLQLPVITEGCWDDITTQHQLLVIGEYLLDWLPSTRAYRLWQFDPQQKNPLVKTLRSGTLPDGFDANSLLTAVQNTQHINAAAAATPGSLDFMRDKIEHVVVYTLESRTMDNVLGWLYDEKSPKINWVNAEPPFLGNSTQYSNPGNGSTANVYKFKEGKLGTDFDLNSPAIDPFHGTPDSIHQQYSKGYAAYFKGEKPDMKGFVANNCSDEVMASLTPTQLPVLNGLASSYAVSDKWFSALPGGTDSNRAFAVTGSAYNITTTYEGAPQYVFFPDRARRQSIWKVLWNNGITDWKIYWSVKWQNYVFSYHLYLKGEIPSVDNNLDDYVAPMTQFMNDAAAGTLPKFSFLEPAWIAPEGATSYHPSGDLVPAERELNLIYQAVANGPGWEKTALIITFSKGGGLYDHVPPPQTIKPWPKDTNDGFSYDVLGPRVPAIVVSPWVDENTVFRSADKSNPLSATSLAATLLEWFGIPRARWGLGDRIEKSETFEEVFQRATPRTDKPKYKNPYDKTYPAQGDKPKKEIPVMKSVDIALGTKEELQQLFSVSNPGVKLTDALSHAFNQTLQRDMFFGSWADAYYHEKSAQYYVKLTSPNHDLSSYEKTIPAMINAGKTALDIFLKGKMESSDMKFFLPFGLAMSDYKSVQMLHFPPSEALEFTDYLYNQTCRRWELLLLHNGFDSTQNTLLERLIDLVPIAAPGGDAKGIAEYNMDFINYVTALIELFLGNNALEKVTAPMVVGGGPAISGFETIYKKQIEAQLPKGEKLHTMSLVELEIVKGKKTHVLCTNHPSRYLYYSDKTSPNDEKEALEIMREDLICSGWQSAMAEKWDSNAKQVLEDMKEKWKSDAKVIQIMKDSNPEWSFGS